VILNKIPGIGKKTAERLVVEMRDRLSDWELDLGLAETSPTKEEKDLSGEAEAALIALGYKPADASKMLSSIDSEEEMSIEDLIRAALQSRLRK